MINMLIIYITCKNIFRNQFELNYHIKYYHQILIKIKFNNEHIMMFKKCENETFKCKYGKNFKIFIFIWKHIKICKNESINYE